ncbi:hypothetical protein CDES_09305 [Corynebacterium deserti GIMN1.010]|uniref:Uncharacterized protein n=1 Tax=Corynebacterium deserti GIMN1.010 TaxID=931089 RepID=A0A0M4CGT7_9CORY|nr:hypothetical protein [Corynebacterium deserti]ALC06252.1 hypothetical protein CDES_09305 [Corynebacterium deserti GIMN1.010]
MPAGIADMTDSLLGWASQTELDLNQRLAGVEYFPQVQLRSDELERIHRFYGTFLARQLAAGANIADLFEMTPCLTVATLVTRASRLSNPSDFFGEYFGGLGLGAEHADVLEGMVEKLFVQVGLTVPADSASALEILSIHAGISNYEVAAVLTEVENGSTEYPFMFDTTLRLAPKWASSLVAGVQELIQFATAHPTSWSDRERESSLPAMIDELVVAELRERPVGTADRETSVGVALRELRPRLILDAERRKVCLRLPEQRVSDGEINWRVSLEGTTRIFSTKRAWGDTSGYSEALDITVERQIRETTVTDTANQITWVVPVVDFNDPVLVFSKRGENLTDKVSLHHQEIYVLAPAEAELEDIVTGQPVPVLDTFEVEGWTSWVCSRVDARGLSSLKVNNEVRCIDPRRRVAFHHPDELVPHVKSISGLPVYAQSLVAEFPPTLSGHDETWMLSISAFAGVGEAGEEIAEPEPLEVPAEGGLFYIFDPEIYDAPWVGEYLVRLRGPRNESFRHEFAIVEGMTTDLEVSSGASFRIPTTTGLSEASLRVRSGEKHFTAEPRLVMVGAQDPNASFIVTTDEGDQMPLRFVPPQIAIELPLTTEPPMWRVTRAVCGPRDLDGAGELRIRPGVVVGDPRVSVRNHHGSPLRTVKMTSPDNGRTWVASMKEIASSTFVMPRGSIEFEWTDKKVDRRVSVTIAVIDKVDNVSGLRIEDGTLYFDDLVQERHLGVWIWPQTAPWVRPVELEVIGPALKLPENLVRAGNLIVQLHTADPFTTFVTPLSPGKAAITVEQEGYYSAQSEEYAQLSAFFGGEVAEPPISDAVVPALWDVSHIWTEQGNVEHLPVVHAALRSSPAAALKGLSASLVPAQALPGKVISSGLAASPFTTEAPATEVHRTAWIGTLQLLGALPGAFKQAEEIGNRTPLLPILNQLEEVAGKNILSTLATGRDSTLDTACIDQSTVAIAGMNETQQKALLDMFFSNADIVPGPLMADNTRLMAVFETFKKRDELREVLQTEGLIKSAVELLRAMRGTQRQLYSSARIRFDKLEGVDTNKPDNMWALTPVVSLVFALSSRLHAHELIGKTRTLDRASSGWGQIADIVPDLVTGDLISAEAMVLGARNPGLVD